MLLARSELRLENKALSLFGPFLLVPRMQSQNPGVHLKVQYSCSQPVYLGHKQTPQVNTPCWSSLLLSEEGAIPFSILSSWTISPISYSLLLRTHTYKPNFLQPPAQKTPSPHHLFLNFTFQTRKYKFIFKKKSVSNIRYQVADLNR